MAIKKAPSVEEAYAWIKENQDRTDLNTAEQQQLVDYDRYVNTYAPKGTAAYNQLRGLPGEAEALNERRRVVSGTDPRKEPGPQQRQKPPRDQDPGQNNNMAPKPPYTKQVPIAPASGLPVVIKKEHVPQLKNLVATLAPHQGQLNTVGRASFDRAVKAIQIHEPDFKPTTTNFARTAPNPNNAGKGITTADQALAQVVQWAKMGASHAMQAQEQAAKAKGTKPLDPPGLVERDKGQER